MRKEPLAIATTVAALVLVLTACRSGVVTNVVDGDTVDVNAVRVRVQGIDTPERGECGYAEAKARVQQLVGGRSVVVINGGGDKFDRYGREIGYITFDQKDLGTILISEGLAKARYDSLDGYGWHRRQSEYRLLDAATPQLCGGW